MFDMMNMLQNAQSQMDNAKKQLEYITVEGVTAEGKIKVVVTATHKVTQLTISPELLSECDAEELEDLLTVAINRAMDAATSRATEEMDKVAQGLMPPGFNLPGLF